MYYACIENKGADQLRGYCEADLRLCFPICKKPVSHDAAHMLLWSNKIHVHSLTRQLWDNNDIGFTENRLLSHVWAYVQSQCSCALCSQISAIVFHSLDSL